MKKNLIRLLLPTTLVMGMATVLWAAVPPPVVQNNFIYDTKFASFAVPDCLGCHGGTDPAQDKQNAVLVTLHHNLINTTVPAVSCYNTAAVTPTTLATGCHVLIPAPGGGFTFQDFRNCLNCHTGQSPHHMSTYAANQDCVHCHGKAIDNPNDGHYIPTYAINTDSTKGGVTPAPHGRSIPDPANPGQTIITQGCAACHQANTAAVPPIYGNNDTHHGTNIGSVLAPGGVGQCSWCHDTTSSSGSSIRGCESCHGVRSLHNISFDTTNANNLGVVVPGNEDPGFGHVGANWDCQGCHSSWNGTAVNPETAATNPSIGSLSTTVVTANTATQLIINGGSFTNTDPLGTTTYKPVVTLIKDGNTVTLTPFSFTSSEVKVLLPATLQQGIYELRVDKSGTFSNLTKLIVAPRLTVNTAVLSASTLTITGVGFGSTPTAQTQALLGVFVDAAQATVVSWSDTKIVATSPAFAAGKTATVKTLYGPVAGTIFNAGPKGK
ncbi:MAG: IPT/TIG domain-containing protein [Steroidobacteraceae bacterium]|nr:IPT/TIG domain-containing protein [Deltaproteobacteria bacterium]